MPKNIKESVVIFIQLLVFYVLPLFTPKGQEMGLILFVVVATLILSSIFGFISNNKLKYFYPIFISVLFIPSIFIYYNDSAFIYVFWHLLEAYLGLLIGVGIKFLITNKQDK